MNDVCYQVFCEYDIGQALRVFETTDVANTWAKESCEAQGLNYDELVAEGLLTVDEREFLREE